MHLAAKNGHGETQCSIAIMCDAGIFSGAGKEDAVYWYTRAVEGGKITSQEYLFDAYSYLIEAYYYGDGVQKDMFLLSFVLRIYVMISKELSNFISRQLIQVINLLSIGF